jgi:hypothetical protein
MGTNSYQGILALLSSDLPSLLPSPPLSFLPFSFLLLNLLKQNEAIQSLHAEVADHQHKELKVLKLFNLRKLTKEELVQRFKEKKDQEEKELAAKERRKQLGSREDWSIRKEEREKDRERDREHLEQRRRTNKVMAIVQQLEERERLWALEREKEREILKKEREKERERREREQQEREKIEKERREKEKRERILKEMEMREKQLREQRDKQERKDREKALKEALIEREMKEKQMVDKQLMEKELLEKVKQLKDNEKKEKELKEKEKFLQEQEKELKVHFKELEEKEKALRELEQVFKQKELKERELREKEQREKAQKEKEDKEKDQKDKEKQEEQEKQKAEVETSKNIIEDFMIIPPIKLDPGPEPGSPIGPTGPTNSNVASTAASSTAASDSPSTLKSASNVSHPHLFTPVNFSPPHASGNNSDKVSSLPALTAATFGLEIFGVRPPLTGAARSSPNAADSGLGIFQYEGSPVLLRAESSPSILHSPPPSLHVTHASPLYPRQVLPARPLTPVYNSPPRGSPQQRIPTPPRIPASPRIKVPPRMRMVAEPTGLEIFSSAARAQLLVQTNDSDARIASLEHDVEKWKNLYFEQVELMREKLSLGLERGYVVEHESKLIIHADFCYRKEKNTLDMIEPELLSYAGK